jgi:hypothetical protein
MEEVNLRREIEQGARAREVLESDAFKAAYKRVQDRIMAEFAATPPDDVGRLQMVRLELKALADVARELAMTVDTGTMASQQVTTIAERAKRFFKMG